MCKDAGSHFGSLNSVEDLHAKSLHMAWDGSKTFRSTYRLEQLLLCKSDSWKAGSGLLQSQELLRLSKKTRGDRWVPRGSPPTGPEISANPHNWPDPCSQVPMGLRPS